MAGFGFDRGRSLPVQMLALHELPPLQQKAAPVFPDELRCGFGPGPASGTYSTLRPACRMPSGEKRCERELPHESETRAWQGARYR